jgi:small-conductance mechanosensitive channel
MKETMDYIIFGNTVYKYVIAFAIFFGGIALVYLFKRFVLFRLKKWAASSETNIDDYLVKSIEKSFVPVFYFLVFYLAVKSLILSPSFEKGLNIFIILLITFLVVKIIISVINYFFSSYSQKSDTSEQRKNQLKGIRGLVNLTIWIIAIIFVLDNLGVKISAVVAGLGIGGIAVALAAQAFLGDLFSSFAIFFDKPFEVGDFIIVGDKLGVVEYIGIKTTRLRAIGGEQLIFANHDLTNSRIHNFKKMERRRVVFNLGVIYQTSAEQLRKIPLIVKDIITKQPDVAFDRGHFASFGDFSINFEFVYFVEGADYNKYMDIQQTINLSIYEAFENERIEFAYPTQTLFVSKTNQNDEGTVN